MLHRSLVQIVWLLLFSLHIQAGTRNLLLQPLVLNLNQPLSLKLLYPPSYLIQTTAHEKQSALERARQLVEEVRAASFPELAQADIQVQLFDNDSDYFRTRFAFPQFLSERRMRYLLRVNPRVFALNAPDDGIRAIIAHELGHVLWFQQRNRIRLPGLVRLSAQVFTARFERRTDLIAIARGYGDGLIAYRRWLYQHIPSKKLPEKQRNYFSPEEITAIQASLKNHPDLLEAWLRDVPLNLKQIMEKQ